MVVSAKAKREQDPDTGGGGGGGESGTLMLQLRAFASCRKSVLDKGTANAEALGWTGA